MKHTYTAQTVARARYPHRTYGYCVVITPPIEHVEFGQDIEGVGWWPWPQPRRRLQRFFGWYKYKADAVRRADDLAHP